MLIPRVSSKNFSTILLLFLPADFKFDLNEGGNFHIARSGRKYEKRMFVCHWYAYAWTIVESRNGNFSISSQTKKNLISDKLLLPQSSEASGEITFFNIFLNSIRSHNPDCTCFPPHRMMAAKKGERIYDGIAHSFRCDGCNLIPQYCDEMSLTASGMWSVA